MTTTPAAAETALQTWGSGDHPARARLRDGVVLRPAGPWSPAVLALLRHLEAVGFDAAPRVVGTGFAADGRETVSFVPGTTPQPYAWSDGAVGEVGVLLRGLHRATAGFQPPEGSYWRPWWGRRLPGSRPVLSHCDTGPWNIVAQDGQPVALIDWENAGPVDALWELAQTAWLNAQLHDDDIAERLGLPDTSTRAGQLRSIVDGYGLAAAERAGFVERMIEFAVHSARAEAVDHAVGPDSTAGCTTSGYPFLWAITWRARSASWMLRHRAVLERAIT
ncbi:MAG TPA: phosphotransferase [Mycobacteriales bacterium]|nr:phosphotransferase [Mycobacteriales bacterium]